MLKIKLKLVGYAYIAGFGGLMAIAAIRSLDLTVFRWIHFEQLPWDMDSHKNNLCIEYVRNLYMDRRWWFDDKTNQISYLLLGNILENMEHNIV